MRPVIAHLTDYGDKDFFVASLRAVVLSLQPEAQIVDISHSVRSFDIRQGSYLLGASIPYFPAGTIFLVVIDPGVGTRRRLLLVKTKNFHFIAPDNGVLSDALRREKPEVLIEVKNGRFFLPRVGRTFDGRDKMAPVAAWLSLGHAPQEFGPRITTCMTFPALKPRLLKNRISGHIVYIDKFGNCLTNIPIGWVRELKKRTRAGIMMLVAGGETAAWSQTYGAGRPGKLIFLPGSQGTIEIAMREKSAADQVGCVVGGLVSIYARNNA